MSKPHPSEPLEEKLDTAVGEATKRRLKATIAAISRRITDLESERAQFEKITAQGHEVPYFLTANTRDLKRARGQLAGYQAQLGAGN